MKTRFHIQGIAFALLLSVHAACAQFNSGSTGAYGPMNITEDTTLDMPADGIFHCTTITISQNKTLSFKRNSGNTPVYLLATGDVKIHGKINVSGSDGTVAGGGQGGPGGFDGGMPGNGSDIQPGSGAGPGGGKGGKSATSGTDAAGGGSYRTKSNSNRERDGATYGSNLLIPLIGGSGGGGESDSPRAGGGGGGGAILIASNTRIDMIPEPTVSNTNSSAIFANGGYSTSGTNPGSGGAIRLVAPVVANGPLGTGGSALLSVEAAGNLGGAGRTRVDCLDRTNLRLTGVQATGSLMVVFPSPMPKLTVTSIAGNAIAEGSVNGVNLLLPSGTPAAQTITVRARDFGKVTPLRIALIPESGDPTYYDVSVDNAATNPADLTTNITVPVNQQVKVQVWTR